MTVRIKVQETTLRSRYAGPERGRLRSVTWMCECADKQDLFALFALFARLVCI